VKPAPSPLLVTWKRPDARRLPDDTRRAPQPNRELQAFGTAESNLCEHRGRKRANRRSHPSSSGCTQR